LVKRQLPRADIHFLEFDDFLDTGAGTFTTIPDLIPAFGFLVVF
jgi:hypothetical protein